MNLARNYLVKKYKEINIYSNYINMNANYKDYVLNYSKAIFFLRTYITNINNRLYNIKNRRLTPIKKNLIWLVLKLKYNKLINGELSLKSLRNKLSLWVLFYIFCSNTTLRQSGIRFLLIVFKFDCIKRMANSKILLSSEQLFETKKLPEKITYIFKTNYFFEFKIFRSNKTKKYSYKKKYKLVELAYKLHFNLISKFFKKLSIFTCVNVSKNVTLIVTLKHIIITSAIEIYKLKNFPFIISNFVKAIFFNSLYLVIYKQLEQKKIFTNLGQYYIAIANFHISCQLYCKFMKDRYSYLQRCCTLLALKKTSNLPKRKKNSYFTKIANSNYVLSRSKSFMAFIRLFKKRKKNKMNLSQRQIFSIIRIAKKKFYFNLEHFTLLINFINYKQKTKFILKNYLIQHYISVNYLNFYDQLLSNEKKKNFFPVRHSFKLFNMTVLCNRQFQMLNYIFLKTKLSIFLRSNEKKTTFYVELIKRLLYRVFSILDTLKFAIYMNLKKKLDWSKEAKFIQWRSCTISGTLRTTIYLLIQNLNFLPKRCFLPPFKNLDSILDLTAFTKFYLRQNKKLLKINLR